MWTMLCGIKHCNVKVKKGKHPQNVCLVAKGNSSTEEKTKTRGDAKTKKAQLLFFFSLSVKYLQQSEIKQCSQNLFNTFSPRIELPREHWALVWLVLLYWKCYIIIVMKYLYSSLLHCANIKVSCVDSKLSAQRAEVEWCAGTRYLWSRLTRGHVLF